MPDVVTELKSQAERLTVPQRAELALFLPHSLEPVEEGAPAAWQAEINSRVTDILNDAVVGRPIDDVLADLRLRYP